MKKPIKYALFWLLSCTWGIIMTLIGAIAAFVLIVCGHRPYIFYGRVCFELGQRWGGVSFGGFFFVQNGASLSMKQHEAGHSLQNIILGPLMPFVVGVPSAFRCWIRNYNYKGKVIAASVVLGLAAAASITGFVLGIIYSVSALTIICALITIYAGILAAWMFGKEIPQYANGTKVDYDTIWFEGCATRWGEKCFSLD